MPIAKRYWLIPSVVVATLAIIVAAGFAYYHFVYVPAHEPEWRREAQAQWLQIALIRKSEDVRVDNYKMSGHLEDAKILHKCFKKDQLAEEVADILATAAFVHRHPGVAGYRWYFRVPKPKEPDATIFVYMVDVEGNPPVVQFCGGAFTAD